MKKRDTLAFFGFAGLMAACGGVFGYAIAPTSTPASDAAPVIKQMEEYVRYGLRAVIDPAIAEDMWSMQALPREKAEALLTQYQIAYGLVLQAAASEGE